MLFFVYTFFFIMDLQINEFKFANSRKQAHCGTNDVTIMAYEFNNKNINFIKNKKEFTIMSTHLNVNKIAKLSEQAHCGSIVVTNNADNTLFQTSKTVLKNNYVPINTKNSSIIPQSVNNNFISTSRSGTLTCGIELTYPKLQKVQWFKLHDNTKTKFDTTKKYIQINSRSGFYYKPDVYDQINKYNRHLHRDSMNKQAPGVPGISLPSNPLPVQTQFIKPPKVVEYTSLYDMMYGDDDDDDLEFEEFINPITSRSNYDLNSFLLPEFQKPLNPNAQSFVPSFVAQSNERPLKLPAIKDALSFIDESNTLSFIPPSNRRVATLLLEETTPIQEESFASSVTIMSPRVPSYSGLVINLNKPSSKGKRNIEHDFNVQTLLSKIGYNLDFSSFHFRHPKVGVYKFFIFADAYIYLVCKSRQKLCTRAELVERLFKSDYDLINDCTEMRTAWLTRFNADLSMDLLSRDWEQMVLDQTPTMIAQVATSLRTLRDYPEYWRFDITSSPYVFYCTKDISHLIEDALYFGQAFPPDNNERISYINPTALEYHQGGTIWFKRHDENHEASKLSIDEWDAIRKILTPKTFFTQQSTAQGSAYSNIRATVSQVSNAVGSVPLIAKSLSDLSTSVNEFEHKISLFSNTMEYLRFVADKLIDVKYIFSSALVPTYIKLYKGITLFLEFFNISTGLKTVLPDNFIQKCSDYFGFTPTAQAGESLPIIGTLISSFFSFFNGGKSEATGLALEYCKRFNTFSATLRTIRETFSLKSLGDLMGNIVEFVCTWTGTNNILHWFNDKTGRSIDKFVNMAATYLLTSEDDVGNDELLDNVLLRLNTDKREILNLIAVNGWTKEIFRLREICKSIDSRMEIYNMRKENIDGRVTPFCLCFHGASQIGKSQMAMSVVDQILAHIPLGMRLYTRGNTEHYDGYNGHQAILVDDWSSRVETDYAELLDWVTCNPTILKMASLDSGSVGKKGTTLKAKLIVLCTNTPYPPMTNMLLNPEAVLKRRHCLIHVTKVQDDFDPNFGHLRFRYNDPSDAYAPPLSEPMTYVELMASLQAKYDDHMRIQDRLLLGRQARRTLLAVPPLPQAQGFINNMNVADTVNFGLGFAESGLMATSFYAGAFSTMKWFCGTSQSIALPAISVTCAALSFLLSNLHYESKPLLVNDKVSAAEACDQGRFKVAIELITDPSSFTHYQALSHFNQWKDQPIMFGFCQKIYSIYGFADLGVPFVTNYDSCAISAEYLNREPKHLKKQVRAENIENHSIIKSEYLTHEPHRIKQRVIAEQNQEVVDNANVVFKDNKTAEATNDKTALTIATTVIKPRMVRINFSDGDHDAELNGLIVSGTSILAPYHLFYNPDTCELRQSGYIKISFPTTTSFTTSLQRVSFNPDNLVHLKGDWCLYTVGKSMPTYSNISSLFVREGDLNKCSSFWAQLLCHNPTGYTCMETSVQPIMAPVIYKHGNRSVTLQRGWSYRANTQVGDCGSILLSFGVNMVGKIMGIHVCGSEIHSQANAELVTSEDLSRALALVR